MQDKTLLDDLLAAESEERVLEALLARGFMADKTRWRYVGDMPNNQAIVHAQQSTAAAALLEKYTNAVDAILLRCCKAAGVDPRSAAAPQSMANAIDKYFGDVADQFKDGAKLRSFAEEHIVLYATGSKVRPCLSLYDAGEGQLPQNFPSTFCSLIHGGSGGGSYKGAIPFVQGRFNMGGTGVLPFCSEKHKMQLVVSRVPPDVAKSTDHEWGYTIFCLFPSKQDPSWHYLVGSDGQVLTAGSAALGLLPKIGAKSGEVCLPRERDVSSGTLIKMFDFQAARSNICGEQFKKLEDFLLRPALPMRIIECRDGYKANVMRVTVWDRLGRWTTDKLEDGFEEGAAITITLDNGEVISGEIRVFKAVKGESDDPTQTGLRALINGQSHARRDAQFFKTKAVDKEHIATSMLVTLDCTELGQASRNALFMSNRETFRDDPLLAELFAKLQKELHDHPGLIELNKKRYEDKVENAVTDDDGIKALEELLATDPTLASLFGSFVSGKVAASMAATSGIGAKVKGTPAPFKGTDFPTFFHRADMSTSVDVLLPQKGVTRVSFLTDVKNNYFSRMKYRGTCHFVGDFQPTFSLFNGRLNFSCKAGKGHAVGDKLTITATITDSKGSGPFSLDITATVAAPIAKLSTPSLPKMPKVPAGPSRPDIEEVSKGPDDPPLTVERNPLTDHLQLLLNTKSKLLDEARQTHPPEEVAAVDFVFKYGLALVAMGLLDLVTKTPEWKTNEPGCRERIAQTATGIARVIVPICLSLPAKIPKLSYV